MANFLTQYQAAPARVQSGPTVRAKPPQPSPIAGVNPAMVAYLSNGSPNRQLFASMLSTKPAAMQPDTDPSGQLGVGQYGAPPTLPGAPGTTTDDGSGPPGSQPQVPPGGGGGAPSAAAIRDAEEGDYLADSFLQRLFAQRDADLKMRRGGAFKNYQEALLGFGSRELTRETLGRLLSHPEYRDASGVTNPDQFIEQFSAGVSAEPDTSFSTLAQLRRALREDTRETDAELGLRRNLAFSGTRARALRDLDYGHQGRVNEETQRLLNALNSITGNVTGAESDWMERIRGGEEAAYSRALMRALAQALRASFGGGGSSGGGSTTTTTDTGSPGPADWLQNVSGPGPAYIEDESRLRDAMNAMTRGRVRAVAY